MTGNGDCRGQMRIDDSFRNLVIHIPADVIRARRESGWIEGVRTDSIGGGDVIDFDPFFVAVPEFGVGVQGRG